MKAVLRFAANWTAAALLLSGCAVGPNYQRPEVEVPASLKESPDWKTAQPSDHLPRGPWWETFSDAALNELESQVDISNQTLRAAEAQMRQAQAVAAGARGGLFPALSADGSATRGKSGQRGSLPGQTVDGYSAGLSASWEIDLWGRLRRIAESARADAQASEADLESARLSAHSLLAANYFTLRVADAQMQLYERILEDFKRSLQMTQNRYDQGVAGRLDVAQAESQLRNAQVQAIELRVQRTQAEHAIAVLLGKPASVFSLASAPMVVRVPVVPPILPATLLERRPDVAAAERRVAAANAGIGVARAAYFPTLGLSASAGYESSRLAHLLEAPNEFWSLGGSLVAPLVNFGRTRSLNDQARAEYDGTVAAYRQTALAALQEAEDNLALTRILAEESVAQEQALQAARLAQELTLNQYKAGTIDYLNVITAQNNTLTSERASVELMGRRLIAAVSLLKALGGNAADVK